MSVHTCSTSKMFAFVYLLIWTLIPDAFLAEVPVISKQLVDSKNDIFISEFEILDMSNHDGRLLNGYCCNGQRPSTTFGCKGGNTTCLPYWRVCIAELKSDMASDMGREAVDNLASPSTTTKKPSMIQSFLSKIFGNGKSSSDKNRYLKDIIDRQSPSTCRVGFWTSEVILPDTTFPIQLRKPLVWKSLSETDTAARSGAAINRNVVSIIEIWSKNVRTDAKNRLIARQIQHYNVFIEPDSSSSEWFYGGRTVPNIRPTPPFTQTNELLRRKDVFSKTALARDGSISSIGNGKFRYKFRWHVKSMSKLREEGFQGDDLSQFNISNEGCPNGYQGPDCTVPVCMEGCDSEHGYCEQPGQCLCRFGWTGMFCSYCLTLPGCVHGYCNRPLECRCEEGWTGVFCSIPKCKEGCHSTNGYCTIPGECKCKFGWQGENCTECSTLPGCQHGTCNEPLDCNCQPGWQGTFCSTAICSTGCENGWCKRPNECRCKVGFKGENCTECVPYPGCQHGACSGQKPWTCECEPGYGGFTCNERLDWCESHPNPCQNGGTCVSVEKANGHYLCQCTLGYTGQNCDKIAN